MGPWGVVYWQKQRQTASGPRGREMYRGELMRRAAIVGFGGAGYSAARALRARDPQAEIHVYTDTGLGPCNPMLTTYYVKGAIPYRKTFDEEIPLPGGGVTCAYLSAACMHCADAPCVAACPSGCLFKDPDTGFTVYDNTNCIGCKSCAMACPFAAPRYRPSDGKMVKCDGCNIRVKNGLLPACVRACSFGALTCVTEEEYRQSGSDKACAFLLRQLREKAQP